MQQFWISGSFWRQIRKMHAWDYRLLMAGVIRQEI